MTWSAWIVLGLGVVAAAAWDGAAWVGLVASAGVLGLSAVGMPRALRRRVAPLAVLVAAAGIVAVVAAWMAR